MATSHHWFGADADNQLVMNWLRANGAVPLNASFDSIDYRTASELVLHFPVAGPVVYWPKAIDLSDYEGNGPRFKAATLARIAQKECPDRLQIDADRSAVAGLAMPYRKEGLCWASGGLWFPTPNLRKTFPELGRICDRFERWLRNYPLVYDGTGKEPLNLFEQNLAGIEGFAKKTYALPDAYRMLLDGACMVDRIISAKSFQEFLRRLELRGRRLAPDGR